MASAILHGREYHRWIAAQLVESRFFKAEDHRPGLYVLVRAAGESRALASSRPAEPSESVRQRVVAARRRQLDRLSGEGVFANARMSRRQLRKHCALDDDGRLLLRQAMEMLAFSARAYDKILKVARTIADLEDSETVLPQHVSEAVNYRTLDRRLE